MFFGSARRAFLDYLGRLTPQALFLTLALVFGARLDLTKFVWTFHGFVNVIPFALCLVVFFGAALASITLFIEEAAISSNKFKRHAGLSHRFGRSKFKKIKLLLRGAWTHNKAMFIQAVLVVAVMEVGLLAVFTVAIQAAMASPLLRAHG